MSDEPPTAVAVIEEQPISLGVMHAQTPEELVKSATSIATVLARVIEERKLYKQIEKKRYVFCEAWTTLGVMLGVTPHEVETRALEDGRYEAVVELRRMSDGRAITRASSECGGPQEPLWQKRSPNARRSMAQTRATAKAGRLAFAWIVTLAGFAPTPAEEMDDERTTSEELEPTADTPLGFGRMATKKITELPGKYLEWMVEDDRQLGPHTAAWQRLAREELARRENGKGAEKKEPAAPLNEGLDDELAGADDHNPKRVVELGMEIEKLLEGLPLKKAARETYATAYQKELEREGGPSASELEKLRNAIKTTYKS